MSQIVLPLVIGLLLGFGAGLWARGYLIRRRNPAALRSAQLRKGDADREARGIIREAEIQAKAEVLKAREAFESSTKEQRRELNESLSNLNKREQVLTQREDNLDRKADTLARREEVVDKKADAAEAATQAAKAAARKADETMAEAEARLAKLAGMTRDEARKGLLEQAQQEIQGDLGTYLRREKERAEKNAEHEAQKIVLGAMQRYAGNHVSETMTRSVSVSGEDVKGRIIGREGRNIRALEQATGCSILIDDTPETVVISSADPLRREIAAIALEKLVASGRIQPQRIEETVAAVRADEKKLFAELGAAAASDALVPVTNAEELEMLGRLKFRTSFTQNVLLHAREVAAYAGMIAAELGMDESLARRVGLFHDIGKAFDHEVQGPHALIGADFLRRCGEPQDVVDGVAGHHGETDSTSVYAVLASVADTISSARPGARSESDALYLGRIEKLEKLALSMPGATRAFAVQAGRDLRVIVDPETTDDNAAMLLASELSAKIEQEVQFAGQIRVTVIREKRCVEFAR